MRKLKLQVQTTLDGFMAGPNGEMDWLTFDWTEDIKQHVEEITNRVDTIVLGRKLAQGFIPHWAAVAADSGNPEVAAGQLFTRLPKVVFSNSLAKSEWDNTVLATGDLATEINHLKQQAGHDIMAYGGGAFVSALIEQGLVDEFHLFVNPIAIGQGMPIFSQLGHAQPLALVQATPFDCGIVALHYQLK